MAIATAACGSSDDSRSRDGVVARPPGGAPIRDCRERVEGGAIQVSPGRDVVVGPVTFLGAGYEDTAGAETAIGPARLRAFLQGRAARELPLRERRFIEGAVRGGRDLHPGLKHLLLVEAGKAATIAIARSDQRHASLLYGQSRFPHSFLFEVGDGDPAVELRACPGGLRPEEARRVCGWRPYRACLGSSTQFNGGFIVDGPRCVTVEVWPTGARAPLRRRVGFGTAC